MLAKSKLFLASHRLGPPSPWLPGPTYYPTSSAGRQSMRKRPTLANASVVRAASLPSSIGRFIRCGRLEFVDSVMSSHSNWPRLWRVILEPQRAPVLSDVLRSRNRDAKRRSKTAYRSAPDVCRSAADLLCGARSGELGGGANRSTARPVVTVWPSATTARATPSTPCARPRRSWPTNSTSHPNSATARLCGLSRSSSAAPSRPVPRRSTRCVPS